MPSDKPHVILIDGMSGVGKSRLANQMADQLGGVAVHLDDVYPGWGGLVTGRDHVIESVLIPLATGRGGQYTSWDWEHNVAGDVVRVGAATVLIVEGCGISTDMSRGLADTTVWVECEEDERRARLMLRDGDRFAEHLETWDAQVLAHMAENDPRTTATVVVNTTSRVKTMGG